MASNKDKMFGCPACGFRVSSGEEACPRCGNAFDKETRFECPFCGEMVERGAKSCDTCHVDYAEFREKTEARGGDDSIDSLLLEIIKLESTSVKQDDKRFSCPKCAWMLDGSEEKCPKCGASFTEDVSFQCPICGALVSQESPKCPECDADFSEEDEARALQHEAAEFNLDEIATAAAQTPPPPEEPVPQDREKTPRGKAMEDISAVTDKIASTFSKIAETMKVESTPEPIPSQTPMEEVPSEEPASMPKQKEQTASDETRIEAEQKEALPELAAEPSPPPVKRTKTRKLKAKPK